MAKSDILNVLKSWQPDMDKGIVARAASLLDFAAKKVPKQIVPWPIITKMVLGGSRIPDIDSKLCVDMMSRGPSMRWILGRDYNRGMQNIRGYGVRASTDDDDYANTQLRRDATSFEGARKRFVKSATRVDPKKMRDPELRSWVQTDVSKALATCNEKFSQLLLPPGEDTEQAKKAKGDGKK